MPRKKWSGCDQTQRFRVSGRKVKGFTQRKERRRPRGRREEEIGKVKTGGVGACGDPETRNVLASLGVDGGAILFVH
jgi:hypothetical protein